jgi:energy-coupling factor transporter ATP-binding protein EcfA2
MLTRFTVEGFKSFGRDLSLDLGQINVLIGANGSGKSNILEALGLLGCAAAGRLNDYELQVRGVRPGLPSLYRSSFAGRRAPAAIKMAVQCAGEPPHEYAVAITIGRDDDYSPFRITQERVAQGTDFDLINDLTGRRPRVRTRVNEKTSLIPTDGRRLGQLLPAALARLPEELRAVLEASVSPLFYLSLRDYAIYAPSTLVLRGLTSDPTLRDPVGIHGGRLAEAVNQLLDVRQGRFGSLDLEEVLDLLDWVGGVDVADASRTLLPPGTSTLRQLIRFTDKRMAKGRNRLSAHDASEGALYILFLLVLALHPRIPPVFAIDNFDHGLHPRLAQETIRLFCRIMLDGPGKKRQALLTTHNPLVLDGLDITDDRVRLLAVDRDNNGFTTINRIRIDPDFFLRNKAHAPLSKLWITGRLGGVPDL